MSADRVTRVTRESFRRLLPMVRPHPLPVLPTRTWTDAEWERIQLGYRARSMDDKWDVLTEGDVVHLHQSWTGYAVYQATFAPAEGGGREIASALVETDPRRHRYSGYADTPEYHCVMLELLLSTVLLGQEVPELRKRWLRLRTGTPGGRRAPARAVEQGPVGARRAG